MGWRGQLGLGIWSVRRAEATSCIPVIEGLWKKKVHRQPE